MLTGPQQKFCDGFVKGLTQTDAYCAAYPHVTRISASTLAGRLLDRPAVRDEIQRLRSEAQKLAGSAVLTLAEKRRWLARLIRADLTQGDVEGDLLTACDIEARQDGRTIQKLRISDKLAAIKLDNDLSGETTEPKPDDALLALLARIRK